MWSLSLTVQGHSNVVLWLLPSLSPPPPSASIMMLVRPLSIETVRELVRRRFGHTLTMYFYNVEVSYCGQHI